MRPVPIFWCYILHPTHKPIWFLAVWVIVDLCFANLPSVAGQESTEESPFYQQAVVEFGGPSTFEVEQEHRDSLVAEPYRVQAYSGVVLDWNEKGFIYISKHAKRESAVSTDRVVRVMPFWGSESGTELHRAHIEHRFSDVIRIATQRFGANAPTQKLPRWQQRMIHALIVDSLVAQERWDKAAQLYKNLATESPPPLLASVIPIPWTDSVATISDRDKMKNNATEWMESTNLYLQLLGASWLLDGADRERAIAQLQQLSQSNVAWVAAYAQCQLWRTMAPKELSQGAFSKAIAIRDSLIVPLQAGPTSLLGDRLSRGGARDLAIEQWSRVAVLHPERYALAKRCATSASEAIRSDGSDSTAQVLEKLFPLDIKAP
jgi:hypothetical protein